MLAMMLSPNCSSRLGAVKGLPFSIFLNFEWSGLERLGLVPRQLQGENNTLCDKLAVLNVSQHQSTTIQQSAGYLQLSDPYHPYHQCRPDASLRQPGNVGSYGLPLACAGALK